MIKTIQQLDVDKKKILLRVDFNVPMTQEGEIANDYRIVQALPTIKHLLERQSAVILMSHLKRPKGKYDPKLSLRPCADHLQKLLGQDVLFSKDSIGSEALNLKKSLKPGQILLLENLRFHAEEQETPSPEFARALAQEAQGYINDAFGCSHRREASVFDVPQLFQGKRAMGLLCEKEQHYFQKYILNSTDPITAIIGGAKVSSKLGVLKSLLPKVKTLMIGGAMANTFLAALKKNLAKSMVELDYLDAAQQIMDECQRRKIELILPQDLVYSDQLQAAGSTSVVKVGQAPPENQQAVDVGPESIQAFKKGLENAQVIFWNGPLGVFEVDAYAKGTEQMARFLAKTKAVKIIGGGDSAAAVEKLNLKNSFDHVSTGGGAALELIEKGHLPALDVLND